MEDLEITSYDGEGYKALVYFGAWRVAVLNYTPRNRRGNISRIEKHVQTDEVFVLLKGNCELLIAGSNETYGDIKRIKMEPGSIYNIKKNIWHACELEPNTSVLIVENGDTSEANSIRVNLPPFPAKSRRSFRPCR